MIRIEINENELWQSDKNCGVCGEANSTELVIAFSDGWQNLSKKIVFYDARGQSPVTVLLTEEVRLSGQSSEAYLIKIPAEPLKFEGNIEYAVEGFAENVKKKAICGKFKVRYAPDTNIEDIPEDVALSVGEQLQAEADRLGKLGDNIVPKVGENGNWFVYSQETGDFADTGISATGPKGEQGEQGFVVNGEFDYVNGGITADKTFAEIKEVYSSGRAVVLRLSESGTIYKLALTTVEAGSLHFAAYTALDIQMVVKCNADDDWSYKFFDFEAADNKTGEISESSGHDKYPTAKAVVDYVAAELGTAFDFKGSVDVYMSLPKSGMKTGDAYRIENDSCIFSKATFTGLDFYSPPEINVSQMQEAGVEGIYFSLHSFDGWDELVAGKTELKINVVPQGGGYDRYTSFTVPIVETMTYINSGIKLLEDTIEVVVMKADYDNYDDAIYPLLTEMANEVSINFEDEKEWYYESDGHQAYAGDFAVYTGSGWCVLTTTEKARELTEGVFSKADKATTLAGYGITDAYTKEETETYINETFLGGAW